MARPEAPKGNRLLVALTVADWQRWRHHLERVDLKLGQVLFEPGRPQRHAYFPTGAIASLVHVMSNGAALTKANSIALFASAR